jgi:hypothetical protein
MPDSEAARRNQRLAMTPTRHAAAEENEANEAPETAPRFAPVCGRHRAAGYGSAGNIRVQTPSSSGTEGR